jgi:hypothetical protein
MPKRDQHRIPAVHAALISDPRANRPQFPHKANQIDVQALPRGVSLADQLLGTGGKGRQKG